MWRTWFIVRLNDDGSRDKLSSTWYFDCFRPVKLSPLMCVRSNACTHGLAAPSDEKKILPADT